MSFGTSSAKTARSWKNTGNSHKYSIIWILPKACLWCCADWLYEEREIPDYLVDTQRLHYVRRARMSGTKVTRKWMELLGGKQHYVTKDGTNTIIL